MLGEREQEIKKDFGVSGSNNTSLAEVATNREEFREREPRNSVLDIIYHI